MTPDEIARSVVEPWYRGPYNLHQMDSPEMLKEVADIAAALLRYGDERAAQERIDRVAAVEAAITDLVSRMNPDNEEYYSAVCFHLRQLTATLRRP